jgi:hypothetical protein
MSDDVVTIAPTNGDTARKPGETIELTASWSLAAAPSSVVVRLIWFARGIEVSEGAVIASKNLPEAVRGEYPVTFTLPKAPYSFTGKVVKLHWAVELIVGNAGTATWEFNLSPSGQAIVLKNATSTDATELTPDPVWDAIGQNPGMGDAFAFATQVANRSLAGPGGSKILAKGIAKVASVIGFVLVGMYFLLRPSAPRPVYPPVAQVRRAPVVPAGAPASRVPATTPAPEVVLGPPRGTSEWVVSARAFGPILFDRSVEATEAALGTYFKVIKDPRGCSWPQFANGPQGSQPIIDGNTVVGIKIQDGSVETSQHVKIGTLETAVRAAYFSHGDSVSTTRADSGYHEMIIIPRPGVTTYQIIFGIANGRVLSYRAGNAGEMIHRQQC